MQSHHESKQDREERLSLEKQQHEYDNRLVCCFCCPIECAAIFVCVLSVLELGFLIYYMIKVVEELESLYELDVLLAHKLHTHDYKGG